MFGFAPATPAVVGRCVVCGEDVYAVDTARCVRCGALDPLDPASRVWGRPASVSFRRR
jgi:hypothetical protein